MCEYCHQEYCCLHGHHARHFAPFYRGFPGPGAYLEPVSPQTQKEFLEEEKAALERRLKSLESRLQELGR